MKSVGIKRPTKEEEPKWERVVSTPPGITKALVYPVSCIMPESSTFKAPMLPTFAKKEDTWRILVIAGKSEKASNFIFPLPP